LVDFKVGLEFCRLTQFFTTAWKEVKYKPLLHQLVARVSARVFLGPELCDNEEWLNISKTYAVDAFIAARALRTYPIFMRPIIHWFLPECRKLRQNLAAVRRIITPVIQSRREGNRLAREGSQAVSKVADTIGWLDETAKGRPYDAALAQLGLAFAAIHTTTEIVSGLISDLCANPEWFEPLRQEIIDKFGQHGWSKKTLNDLRLMDSAMKESQRHHFGDIGEHFL
jgi:cytochrome P450